MGRLLALCALIFVPFWPVGLSGTDLRQKQKKDLLREFRLLYPAVKDSYLSSVYLRLDKFYFDGKLPITYVYKTKSLPHAYAETDCAQDFCIVIVETAEVSKGGLSLEEFILHEQCHVYDRIEHGHTDSPWSACMSRVAAKISLLPKKERPPIYEDSCWPALKVENCDSENTD